MEEKTPRFPSSIVEETHLIDHLRKKRVSDLENSSISMARGSSAKLRSSSTSGDSFSEFGFQLRIHRSRCMAAEERGGIAYQYLPLSSNGS